MITWLIKEWIIFIVVFFHPWRILPLLTSLSPTQNEKQRCSTPNIYVNKPTSQLWKHDCKRDLFSFFNVAHNYAFCHLEKMWREDREPIQSHPLAYFKTYSRAWQKWWRCAEKKESQSNLTLSVFQDLLWSSAKILESQGRKRVDITKLNKQKQYNRRKNNSKYQTTSFITLWWGISIVQRSENTGGEQIK